MYLAEIHIQNFRSFGTGERAFKLSLTPGLTALVGENDAGKTSVIDALRCVLGTRDQEQFRVDESDFHRSPEGDQADDISIRLVFRDLTKADRGAFVEYLTFEEIEEHRRVCLVLIWSVKRSVASTSRRAASPEWRTGANGDGPLLDYGTRSLLTATYLRPLRDAERAMSAGRGSRLSQILQHTSEIKDTGVGFDGKNTPDQDPRTLSVLGLGDFANYLFRESQGIKKANNKLNDEYLKPLSFAKDLLRARIEVAGSRNDAVRLRQLLEKLELTLSEVDGDNSHSRGLGSNNLLFIACELLLLAAESDGFPVLLIEEPEAHLHPQRQLRLMAFLQAQVAKKRADGQQIQIILTTHSPSIASDLCLDNVVLIDQGQAFPLRKGMTKLDSSDYSFLERFLDATKSNLFFARGVMIVEGDAENILMPVLARLLNRDFAEYGVSVVNVGGVGLGRYARIFMRNDPMEGKISVPVACMTDLDVMPDCAPEIVGKVKPGEEIPKRPPSKRKWRVKSEFSSAELAERRQGRIEKASGQNVQTFVAGEWTFEYDLAFSGLAKEVWDAAVLALADERIHNGTETQEDAVNELAAEFTALSGLHAEVLASHVYAKFEAEGASKAIGAQYLAELLEKAVEKGTLSADGLCSKLPNYVLDAIGYVTSPIAKPVAAPSNVVAVVAEQCLD